MKAVNLNELLLGLSVHQDIDPQYLRGWTPIKIQFRPEGPTVAWFNFQNTGLGQPRFFKEMVEDQVINHRGNRQIILTPIKTLTALQSYAPGLTPTGFIFHVSRCGSTLLANILSALPQNLVLVEPHLINKILLSSSQGVPEPPIIGNWLTAVISALGQPLQKVEQNYFIKFSSWNILHLPYIRKFYPEVPYIIVYRDPVEVMVSHLKNPGGWMRAKRNHWSVARRVQIPASDIEAISSEEYCARVLSNFYRAAIRHTNKRTMVVNYNQISEWLLRQLLAFCGMKATDDEVATMMSRSKFYAKDPQQQQIFSDDRDLKQRQATPATHFLVNEWVMKAYEYLETLKV
jgi:hypothetical protein